MLGSSKKKSSSSYNQSRRAPHRISHIDIARIQDCQHIEEKRERRERSETHPTSVSLTAAPPAPLPHGFDQSLFLPPTSRHTAVLLRARSLSHPGKGESQRVPRFPLCIRVTPRTTRRGGKGNSYFVILVIDAPGAVLSNNRSKPCPSCRGSELVPSAFGMGDGKEGERQPLLKNENVTYSSHGGSDAIGTECRGFSLVKTHSRPRIACRSNVTISAFQTKRNPTCTPSPRSDRTSCRRRISPPSRVACRWSLVEFVRR